MGNLDENTILTLLEFGTIEVQGLLPWSSNYTFLVRVCPNTAVTSQLQLPPNSLPEIKAVYKPRRGERPLWDFPRGTLSLRERGAYLISRSLDWNLVPPTILRDGPNGFGSLQLLIEHDPDIHYFAFEGDPQFRDQLQKIALLDILINNADRKAGHVLLAEQKNGTGKLWGIDHGICFHPDDKLRTVIWEFAGQPIPPQLKSDIINLKQKLETNQGDVYQHLLELLSFAEIKALSTRLENIIETGTFKVPGPGRHYPWPPV